jgi:hypothetical protein
MRYQNDHKNKTYLFVLWYHMLVWNNFEPNLKTYLSSIWIMNSINILLLFNINPKTLLLGF